VRVGSGHVQMLAESPTRLAHAPSGADRVLGLVDGLLRASGHVLQTRNHLLVRRGPYLVAAVFDESVSEEPLRLSGRFIDLLNPALPYRDECVLRPGEHALLYDLDRDERGGEARVVAAAARVRGQEARNRTLTFTVRGPRGTQGVAAVRLPAVPATVAAEPPVPVRFAWCVPASTARVTFPNLGQEVRITVAY